MKMEVENVEQQNYSFWDFKGKVDYVDKWYLMGSPFPMLIILFTYLFFVLKLGPQYMKNRSPYKLNNLLLAYNAFQVGFSLYLMIKGTLAIREKGLLESKCLMDDENNKMRIVNAHYLYFIAKLTELLDTIFFVLRKKWNQISFLHVYHHSVMYLASWTTLKFEPTYSLVFLGTLNSYVHVIMYAYYGLSAFPGLEKYLWWKKYITKMQLIQFMMIITQITCNSIVSECPLSYILLTICWAHAILFIYLFTDFYIKSYRQKRRESQNDIQNQKGNLKKSELKHLNRLHDKCTLNDKTR